MVRSTWYEDEPGSYRTRIPSFGRWSSVVTLFLIINFAAFILEYVISHLAKSNIIVEVFGLNPGMFVRWTAPLFIYQFITYQFLHGGFFHILINMLILWFFGRELENHLGSRRFMFLYLASGVTGGVIQIAVGLARMGDGLPPVVGASGAVYGILVYYAFMWPNRTVSMFIFPLIVPIKVKWLAALFVGMSLLYGLVPEQGDMVAHMCHLGGALFGFLFYRYEGRYRSLLDSAREARMKKEDRKARDADAEMDRLLQKIHDRGIHSLTDAERKFLSDTSRNYRKRR